MKIPLDVVIAAEAAVPLCSAGYPAIERDHVRRILEAAAPFFMAAVSDRIYAAESDRFRAEGVAAERESIIALASRVRADFPADHPPGARASFADYLRVLAEEKPEGPKPENFPR